jgi:hypothetical protein
VPNKKTARRRSLCGDLVRKSRPASGCIRTRSGNPSPAGCITRNNVRSTQKKPKYGPERSGDHSPAGDRLIAQPQEHQHSAAKRDAGPTVPGRGFNIGLAPGERFWLFLARGIVTEGRDLGPARSRVEPGQTCLTRPKITNAPAGALAIVTTDEVRSPWPPSAHE